MFPSEPLAIGGVLDRGIGLYRATFTQTIKLAALAAIPYVIATAIMGYAGSSIVPGQELDAIEGPTTLLLIALPFVYLGLFFLSGAVGHRLVALARSEPVSTSADMLFGLKVMFPLTVVAVLYVILLSLGLLLLVIPGFIIMVTMSLFLAVPIMEQDRSAWSSLWRSHALVWRGNYWRTATVIAVMSIIGLVVSVGLYLVIGAVSFAQASTEEVNLFYVGADALANLALTALIMPFSLSMMLMLYNDIVLRKEGTDLEEQLAQLD